MMVLASDRSMETQKCRVVAGRSMLEADSIMRWQRTSRNEVITEKKGSLAKMEGI